MNQKELNNSIAEETNKWQSILEYGRVFLDRDKELRTKHRFISFLTENKIAITIIGLVFEGVIACFNKYISNSLRWLSICVAAIIVVALFLLIFYRHIISKFIPKEEAAELQSLINQASNYLNNLKYWLTELSPENKVSRNDIIRIDKEYSKAQSSMSAVENRFSVIFGPIDQELQTLALKHCEERLSPLKSKVYE